MFLFYCKRHTTKLLAFVHGKVFLVHVVKACGESRGMLPSVLTLAVNGVEWLDSRPSRLSPRMKHGTY